MRIWVRNGGIEQEAYKVGGQGYDCYPPSTNTKANAETFATIEEAAVFLIEHPGWGIRMNPGTAIIYDNIQISL